MIPVCIFTFRGDALPVLEAARSVVAAGCLPVICDDAADPLPPWCRGSLEAMGCEYLRTTFPRRGNLNGTDCAAGIAGTLAAAAARHDSPVAIKVDADTVLLDPVPFLPGNVGMGSATIARREAFGCAYSLAATTARGVAASLTAAPLDPSAPEDVTIWREVQRSGHPCTLHEFAPLGGLLCAVPTDIDAVAPRRFAALTLGNPPPGGWTDRPLQIARSMAAIS